MSLDLTNDVVLGLSLVPETKNLRTLKSFSSMISDQSMLHLYM